MLRRLLEWWYQDDAAAMQARMLRYVWRYRSRERGNLIERLNSPLLHAFYRPEDMGAPMMLGSKRSFAPRLFVARAGLKLEELGLERNREYVAVRIE